MEFNYDELYGVSIEVYLEKHNMSIEMLINQVETDINILNDNLYRIVRKSEIVNWELADAIKAKLKQKQEHLKRLKEYARKNK